MSDEIRMTLLHRSTNDLIEELLMWRGLAAEHLDRIAELERAHVVWLAEAGNEVNRLTARIAELEALVEGHDPFEDFPPKERGFDCSVMVLGKFEYEEEFTPFTNWDLCVYWFDEERWHPLNGYVKGDDIVRWYALPHEEREE